MLRIPLCLASVGLVTAAPLARAQNPASTITNSGQQLEVEVTCDDVLDEGDTFFDVGACSGLSAPVDVDVNVLFLVDLSGSMGTADAPGVGDANGDGQANTRIDAAIEGFVSLAQSLGSNANVDLGIIGFAQQARRADLRPIPGPQFWLSPPDLGMPDHFETVLRSMDSGGGGPEIGLFTPLELGQLTNYADALALANTAFASQPPGETNLVFFVSDGEPTSGGPFVGPLGQLVNVHAAKINTFGVGALAAELCDRGEELDVIAQASGGTCNAVENPEDLATVLPQAASTRIATLLLSVNGNLVQVVDGPEATELCIESVEILQELDLLGVNFVEATAIAEDGTQVTATKQVVKTMCQLFVGLQATNMLLDPNDVDRAYVVPLMWFDVTEANVPTFEVPPIPELAGLDVYFQVGMHNQAVFPNNPVQMSNGVKVTLGGGFTAYGSATGIWSWLEGAPDLGAAFQVRFDVLAM